MALQRAAGTPSPYADLIPDLVDAQCGYCGRAVSMEQIAPAIQCGVQDGPHGRRYISVHTSYLCPRTACRRPSIAFFEITSGLDATYISDGPAFYPRGQAEPMPDLPQEVQDDRLEAWSCYHGGDYRAAVIMGRAAVQRAVRSLDAEGGGLKAEINDLYAKHKITETLKDFAHETRVAGDDAAHPTTLGKVDHDEAKESLDFMDEFLEHVIALPARRESRKQGRSASGTT
jgi:hypothetical protein